MCHFFRSSNTPWTVSCWLLIPSYIALAISHCLTEQNMKYAAKKYACSTTFLVFLWSITFHGHTVYLNELSWLERIGYLITPEWNWLSCLSWPDLSPWSQQSLFIDSLPGRHELRQSIPMNYFAENKTSEEQTHGNHRFCLQPLYTRTAARKAYIGMMNWLKWRTCYSSHRSQSDIGMGSRLSGCGESDIVRRWSFVWARSINKTYSIYVRVHDVSTPYGWMQILRTVTLASHLIPLQLRPPHWSFE